MTRFTIPPIGIGIFSLMIAIILPLVSGMEKFILGILTIALIFIIYSSAWNLLVYSGQGSLGHAAFFGIGGYASALLASKLGIAPLAGIFLGAIFAMFIGLLIGLTCARLREWFLAMVTFGFAVILHTIAVSEVPEITGGPDGRPVPQLISASIDLYYVYDYYVILLLAVVTVLIIRAILKSEVGLAFAAIRENEVEARAAGIDPVKFRLLAFSLSTYIAGVAGALQAHYLGYISPEIFSIDNSFLPIIYSISGGLITVEGPVIGTVIITAISEGLRIMGWSYERFILIGIMLILIVIFLPHGFISLVERIEKRWKKRGTKKS